MKKIAVIGDIHCQDIILKNILSYLSGKVQMVLAVGDIVDGDGNCSKCISLLRSNKIPCVLGNHDAWFLNNEMRTIKNATKINDLNEVDRTYIFELKKQLEFEFAGIRKLLCHGIGENNMACIKSYDYGYSIEYNESLWKIINIHKYQLMIGGHTHKEMARKIEDLVIINPGSLVESDSSNFAVIDFDKMEIEFFVMNNGSVGLKEIIEYPKS